MSSGIWREVASTIRTVFGSACGLITYGNGRKEIVVAPGYNLGSNYLKSQIYDIDNDSWREGPLVPRRLGCATAVPKGNTFLVVAYAGILKYNVENNDWDVMEKSLASVRQCVSAFWVPDDYFCLEPDS